MIEKPVIMTKSLSGIDGHRRVLGALGRVVGEHGAAALDPDVQREGVILRAHDKPRGAALAAAQQVPADQGAFLALRVERVPGSGVANGRIEGLQLPGACRVRLD